MTTQFQGKNILVRCLNEAMQNINVAEGSIAVDLPRTIPYASGHAPRVTLPSAAVTEGQVPLAYIASKISQMHLQVELKPLRQRRIRTALAVLSVAKLVPTTDNIPVPR